MSSRSFLNSVKILKTHWSRQRSSSPSLEAAILHRTTVRLISPSKIFPQDELRSPVESIIARSCCLTPIPVRLSLDIYEVSKAAVDGHYYGEYFHKSITKEEFKDGSPIVISRIALPLLIQEFSWSSSVLIFLSEDPKQIDFARVGFLVERLPLRFFKYVINLLSAQLSYLLQRLIESSISAQAAQHVRGPTFVV
jgi:hypothetical protein